VLTLKKIRDLNLEAPPQAGRKPHLSAASGIIRAGRRFYVIADDELSLGVFDTEGAAPGELVRLLPGELPLDPVERKAAKPDFESLLLLPSFPGFDHGALFALGSGSKKERRTGALLRLDADHAPIGGAQAFSLGKMFQPLRDEFERLNIEGAVVCDSELRLFQRGNKKDRRNAFVRCRLTPVLETLSAGREIEALEVLAIVETELGEIDGIPLSFTDAAVLRNGDMVFSAAAEDTEDPYDDGRCAGCALGVVGPQGNIVFLERTEPGNKLEGIDAIERDGTIELMLVTDADDAEIPAAIYSARIVL
jgi:hypothetical protein